MNDNAINIIYNYHTYYIKIDSSFVQNVRTPKYNFFSLP